MKRVKLTNNGLLSNTAKLTIGDEIIPFYEATVHLKVGNLATITVTTDVELIDIEALEKHTEVVIREAKK
jgi:hypothetical protein